MARIVVSELIREREYLHAEAQEQIRDELLLVAYMGKLVLDGTFNDRVLVLPLWHDTVNRWGRRRESSIYVEESNGGFKLPSDRIPPGTAINAVSRSRMGVRYYEPLLPAIEPFLADPPSTAPLEHVLHLHGRLSIGGVGAAIRHNLLE